MKLYRCDQRENPQNKVYEIPEIVESLEDLERVACFDHLTAKCVGGSRTNKDFLECDCINLDCDNKDNPGGMIYGVEDLERVFSGVEYYVIYSRNHLQTKKEKGSGRELPPVPRYHVYFPLTEPMTSGAAVKKLKQTLTTIYSFDSSAVDAVRLLFGVEGAKGLYHSGKYKIDEYMRIDGVLETLEQKMITEGREQGTASGGSALTDEEVLRKAGDNPKNGREFMDLYNGIWEPYASGDGTQSNADFNFLCKLAFWTRKDKEQMARIFTSSGLYRDPETTKKASDYLKRSIDQACERQQTIYEPKADAERDFSGIQGKLPSEAEPLQNEALNRKEKASPKNDPDEIIAGFLRRVNSHIYEPIPTGIYGVDRVLKGGLMAGALTIVGAAPGSGKTALVSQIMENIAVMRDWDCIYLNLEMSQDQLIARSISRELYKSKKVLLDGTDILRAYMLSTEYQRMIKETAEGYERKLLGKLQYNPDGLSPDVDDLLSVINQRGEEARKAGRKAPIIAVDYLHLLTGKEKEDIKDVLKRACNGLKSYAVKYETLVVAIMATNRKSNIAVKNGEAPEMESGRDSSNLEYSADLLLSIAPMCSDEDENDTFGGPKMKKLYVLKSRFSECGKGTPLAFHGGQGYFEETDFE